MPRQLALALGHAESFAREDFVAGAGNAVALSLIDRWPDWPARAVVLAGPHGSGKSHLASIWAQMSGARLVSARVLETQALPATLVTGALVVEDLAPGAFDEAALFHLFNLAREEGVDLLVTARTPPSGWPLRLADLASRLRALPVFALAEPDDAALRALVVKLFADRQIAVEEELTVFLLRRIERSYSGLRGAVERLDREALQRKRPVNRALAADVFRDTLG